MTDQGIVFVLDLVGYDARGGNAKVFASLEGAKREVPEVRWDESVGADGLREWSEVPHYPGSTADIWVIQEVRVHVQP